jgi:hypothetical protein
MKQVCEICENAAWRHRMAGGNCFLPPVSGLSEILLAKALRGATMVRTHGNGSMSLNRHQPTPTGGRAMTETLQTEVFRPVDWILRDDGAGVDNPFLVDLFVQARGPGGRLLTVPGFYGGDGQWRVRFSPTIEGSWELTASSSLDALAGRQALVQASPNQNPKVHGPLRVDPENRLHYRYEDGAPCFLLGYECNWLFALAQTDEGPERVDRFLDMIAEPGFNHVMVNAYAYDCKWGPGKTRENDFGPPPARVWPGEHGQHDYSRLNLEYFEAYDRMMWALWRRGIEAHIYLKVYNKMVPWPEKRSREEDLYFDYFVARYQAFPNVVWDFSKECYNEPDKQYVCDRLDRVRSLDAYGHLTTVHDDWLIYHDPQYSRHIDFITDQTHVEWHTTILNQRQLGVGPVFNSEFGYEHGPGGLEDKTYGVVQSPLEVLCRTYEVITAGGYANYYYTNHAWDVIEWQETPAGLPAYGYLYNFFTEIDWQELTPRPEMGQGGVKCMASEDDVVVFRRGPRAGMLAVPRWMHGTTWRGFVMDIESGQRREADIGPLEAGRRYGLKEVLGDGAVAARFQRVT